MRRKNNPLEQSRAELDLLRIFMMCGITTIHFLEYNALFESSNLGFANRMIAEALSTASSSTVNLFMMITGYFLSQKHYSVKRVTATWTKTVVVSIMLFVIFAIGTGSITLGRAVKSFFPVLSFHYWYIDVYIFIVLLCPILNEWLKRKSDEQLIRVCIIIGVCITVFLQLNPFANAQIYIGHAHGVIWCAFLYIIGALLHRIELSKKQIIILGILGFVPLYLIKIVGVERFGNICFAEQNSIFPLLLSVAIFAAFDRLLSGRIKNGMILSTLSAASLHVYLFQEHEMVRAWLWSAVDLSSFGHSLLLWLLYFAYIGFIWVIAIIILIITKPLIKRITVAIDKILPSIAMRIQRR